MKQKVYNILMERNMDSSKFNIDLLCQAGINNIISNLEFYYDKPYTCESVLKELFRRGVMEQIKKTQSKL
jgi:hypothetical protein